MISPTWVWAAVALFAVVGGIIAVAAARGNTGTAADYYLGGRRIGGVVSGLSYAATTYSAFMLVVLTGLTYRGGVGALGFELIYFSGLTLLVSSARESGWQASAGASSGRPRCLGRATATATLHGWQRC